MIKLENLILHSLDEESLYNLDLSYPSFNIEKEWIKRIESYDSEFYLPLLDYIINNKIKKSPNIQKSLNLLKLSFSWKIAVIYDYRYGQVKSVEIRIGENFGKYKIFGKPIIFDWLYSNTNKLLKREIISSNSKLYHLSLNLNEDLSNEIRDLILANKTLNLDIIILKSKLGESFNSFPDSIPLPEGEKYVMYPFSIYSNLKRLQIYEKYENSEILKCENIVIKISPEVSKYLQTISF